MEIKNVWSKEASVIENVSLFFKRFPQYVSGYLDKEHEDKNIHSILSEIYGEKAQLYQAQISENHIVLVFFPETKAPYLLENILLERTKNKLKIKINESGNDKNCLYIDFRYLPDFTSLQK